MIINASRMKSAKMCWRKARNQYIYRLEHEKKATALTDGGAFHAGVAAGLATKDWKHALAEADVAFDKDLQATFLLPEEQFEATNHRKLVQAMVAHFEKAWENEPYEVVQPECEFDVALPNSEHNDITMHWVDARTGEEKWGHPTWDAVRDRAVRSPHSQKLIDKYGREHFVPNQAEDCKCWQPHRLVGKTDALVIYAQQFMLLEHKTTAMLGDMFWTQWDINLQPTAYIYGLSRQLGIPVKGFCLNALRKPTEKQVAAWSKDGKKGVADYLEYQREVMTRTDEEVAEFEEDCRLFCDEWESRIISGYWPKANVETICTSFNRQCEFFHACKSNDEEWPHLVRKDDDYVQIKGALRLA